MFKLLLGTGAALGTEATVVNKTDETPVCILPEGLDNKQVRQPGNKGRVALGPGYSGKASLRW